MEQDALKVKCPFCGHYMGWESDAMSDEIGADGRDRTVRYFYCTYCGADAEFIEGDLQEEEEKP